LRAAGNRLCDLQADISEDNARNGSPDADPDDGGWDFDIALDARVHSAAPSPENTYGVTGIGLLVAQQAGVRHRRLAIAAGDVYRGILNRPEADSPPDFAFLVLLGSQLQDPRVRALGRQRYDSKLGQYGGAQQIAQHMREARHAAGQDGLISYDLGWMVLSATALEFAFPGAGYGAHARIYGSALAEDIASPQGFFDIEDVHEAYYVQGLAWAAVAISWSGADRTLLRALRHQLLDLQLPDGSWYWNADYPDADVQTTAYAVQSLALAFPLSSRALRAARAGAQWLAARQAPSGGWEYAPGLENTEIDAEVMTALFLVRPAPPHEEVRAAPRASTLGAEVGTARTASPPRR
jgi:hypothetical protein